jgi:hypothetical protein
MKKKIETWRNQIINDFKKKIQNFFQEKKKKYKDYYFIIEGLAHTLLAMQI